ncbi:MAG: transporter, family [Blastocatellia bacterium]|jgi:UMF1 family MFS transporter|nr:transporter, family [Blastocatellia bacterium]
MIHDSVTAKSFPKNNPREIFGWTMYDWANSAFSTTVVGAMFGPYLTRLAQDAVGENGVVLSFGLLGAVTAKSLSTFAISLAVFLQVFLLPLIGGIADYSDMKKRLMAYFCYAGVVATCLMFFVTGNLYVGGAILFIWANLAFGAALVCYNAFLPEICTEDQRDKVSSRGFAYGYLGGGLLLALNLGLVLGATSLGISKGLAVRLSLLSAGLWWGGFAIITFQRLQRRAATRVLPPGNNVLTAGLSELISTFRELIRLRHTLQYLIGYLLYNDGIQTVIGASAVFLEQELFRSRGLDPNPAFLIGIFLMVQFVAFGGALLFERIAALLGTKTAIMISLVIWTGLVVYAYAFFHTVKQAWIMSAVIGVVMGGSQALSRSLFSRMIPAGREASFFGVYEISERGTSWLGPLAFSIVVAHTGSYRQAILSLIVFFILGMIILWLTNTDQAVHEAGNVLPEEVKA